ncbi:MAG: urease subunit beta [Flavobacteriaceae bacterium]|nr:urease subunit beta [Flavobacteriaceae bacterium]
MHLTKQESERLLLLYAYDVAKRRKESGLKLNYPETCAYLSGYILESAREGKKTVRQLIEDCGKLLKADEVMEGVADLITDFQQEAVFPDGTKMVCLNNPIPSSGATPVGAYEFAKDDIELNEGREKIKVSVTNRGSRPCQVGSHYHFYEVNPALEFDRKKTRGFRLDIAAGLSERFEPGQTKEVTLVAYGGTRQVIGFWNKVNGSLD